MTTHTPAPWRLTTSLLPAEEGKPSLPYMTLDAGDGNWQPATNQGFHLAGIMSPADAALIGSAHRLLERLAQLLQGFDFRPGRLAARQGNPAPGAAGMIKEAMP